MVRLQDSISERLHHHTFSNMLFNMIFDAHHVQFFSCFGPRVGTWLTTRPIFPAFWLFSPVFSTTLRTRLELPHPSIVGILQCMCTHPIDLMSIHLLRCVHGNECTGIYDVIHNTFATIEEMLASTWDDNNYMCFIQSHSTLLIDESTSCLPKMAFAP